MANANRQAMVMSNPGILLRGLQVVAAQALIRDLPDDNMLKNMWDWIERAGLTEPEEFDPKNRAHILTIAYMLLPEPAAELFQSRLYTQCVELYDTQKKVLKPAAILDASDALQRFHVNVETALIAYVKVMDICGVVEQTAMDRLQKLAVGAFEDFVNGHVLSMTLHRSIPVRDLVEVSVDPMLSAMGALEELLIAKDAKADGEIDFVEAGESEPDGEDTHVVSTKDIAPADGLGEDRKPSAQHAARCAEDDAAEEAPSAHTEEEEPPVPVPAPSVEPVAVD